MYSKTMKTWEYAVGEASGMVKNWHLRTVEGAGHPTILINATGEEALLVAAGQEGWELTSIIKRVRGTTVEMWIFKRPAS